MIRSYLRSKIAKSEDTVGMMARLLSEYGVSRWHRYAMASALMVVSAGFTALSAYLVGDIINQAYVNRNFPAVLQISLVVLVVFCVRGGAMYGQAVILSRIGNSIVAEIQRRLFDKVLQQNLTYFTDRHSAELLSRLGTGAGSANTAITLVVMAIGRDFLTLTFLAGVMVFKDPLMSLFVFVIAPPIVFGLRKLARRIHQVGRSQWIGGTRVGETMHEMVQGIRMVKSFTLENHMRSRFDTNVAAVERDANKMARVSNRSGPLVESLGGVAVALALIYAGYRVIEMGAAPGEFFSFMTAFLLAYEPAKRLAKLNLDLNSALVGVRILFETIDAPTTEPTDDGLPALNVTRGRLEFDRVNFSYRAGEAVLREMSLVAEPGKMTALVGQSGGGKSTVFNLILRFYEVSGGTIAIDGHNIASVSRHSLRNQISYVGQDVFLFRASLRDNIAFGRPDATDAEIVAAAKAAQAHDFIMRLPEGYGANVGERGGSLSGGERQRIAIARALIKNAPLILLDEATASLDSESEHLVQRALSELCKGRTTLVIAHRLSTIMHADRILVVEGGQVVESGRHDELLRKGGRYALFYRLQLAQQETREPVAASGG
jgi:ATP-binding cassette subfamily B protein